MKIELDSTASRFFVKIIAETADDVVQIGHIQKAANAHGVPYAKPAESAQVMITLKGQHCGSKSW